MAELNRKAMDDTAENLAAAAQNAKLVRNAWCACKDQDDMVYYRSLAVGHGWMCGKCLGIIQTG